MRDYSAERCRAFPRLLDNLDNHAVTLRRPGVESDSAKQSQFFVRGVAATTAGCTRREGGGGPFFSANSSEQKESLFHPAS